MRILVENGSYAMSNLGDIAMLDVCIERLRALWPSATIEIATARPDRVLHARLGESATPRADGDARGSVVPILLHERSAWYRESVLSRLAALTPPRALDSGWSPRRLAGGARAIGDRRAWQRVLEADLVVASGGGYLTDSFEVHALVILETLAMAVQLGKPIALFGQGLGPIERPALRRKVRQVLGAASLLALREPRTAPALLASLGARPQEQRVTGDDALVLAHRLRRPLRGDGLGVNLRSSWYSGVGASATTLTSLRAVLRAASERHATPLLGVPILVEPDGGRHRSDDDRTSIARLVGTCPPIDSTRAVIEQVGRCRLVVTGSYHGAVFALAQGVPAIGLTSSPYYADKMLGLAALFGSGCRVLSLDTPGFADALAEHIDALWARDLRDELLAATERQIAAGEAAYARLFERVEAQRGRSRTHP